MNDGERFKGMGGYEARVRRDHPTLRFGDGGRKGVYGLARRISLLRGIRIIVTFVR